MEFYRIKHKPTGLYYKPGGNGNNLTKKGKIYTSGNNVLSYYTHSIPVRANYALRILLQKYYKDAFKDKPLSTNIPREDFEIEKITLATS